MTQCELILWSVSVSFMCHFLSLQRFSSFCLENYNQKLCEDDQSEFLNGWYILVIISDVLAIIGSILKMEIQAKVHSFYENIFADA